MFDFLIRMARAVVDSVLSQLLQQKNIVVDMVMRPVDAIVQQVVGGVWIGKGADAFVQEVRSIVIPGLRTIDTNIGTFSRDIVFARERIDRADADVTRIVKGKLHDKFKFF